MISQKYKVIFSLLGLALSTHTYANYQDANYQDANYQANLNPIELNFNHSALAAGSGCSAQPKVFASGGEAAVSLSELRIELQGHQDGRQTERKACTIVLPILVKSGFALEGIGQSLSYAYERSEQTEGKIAASVVLSGNELLTTTHEIPNSNFPPKKASKVPLQSHVKLTSQPCYRDDFEGILKVSVVLSVYRASPEQAIFLGIDDQNFKYSLSVRAKPC